MKERRLVRVDISFDLLINLMSEDYESGGIIKTIEGLPDDAEFVGSAQTTTNTVTLFFHHDSFEPIPIVSQLPLIMPTHLRDYTPLDLLDDWLMAVKTLRSVDEKTYQVFFKDIAEETREYVK
jgi:hypothetical protein